MLSGDHIYKKDYADMLPLPQGEGAECTISVMEVPWEEASRFGIMVATSGPHHRVRRRSPRNPRPIWLPWASTSSPGKF